MNNHVTLKEFLLTNIGTLENPIPPKDLQIVVAGGENESIKYFDLRHMCIERMRDVMDTVPEVRLFGGDRSHPSIPASLMLTTGNQEVFSTTVDYLCKFQLNYLHHDMPAISGSLTRMTRNGDFAYQHRLVLAFEAFYQKLTVADRIELDKHFDRRAIPLVDCGIYDATAVRSTSEVVELYIPLYNKSHIPVWLVVIIDPQGYVSHNFTMRFTARSEAVIIGKAQLGDIEFSKALNIVSQEYA